jgi:hypothetical protein
LRIRMLMRRPVCPVSGGRSSSQSYGSDRGSRGSAGSERIAPLATVRAADSDFLVRGVLEAGLVVPPNPTDSSAQRARSGLPLLDPDLGAVRFHGLAHGGEQVGVYRIVVGCVLQPGGGCGCSLSAS